MGNYLAFRMSVDVAYDLKWKRWLDDHGVEVGRLYDQDIVPLGTGGVFAEAVLGRSNSAEKLDITRFWDWQDSPIPLQPTEIAAIQTGSRGIVEDTSPGQLSTPIVNITSPTSLPDPAGTAAILQAVQNGSMFRDMSGLQATIGLVQAGIEQTMAGASAAGQQAGENMNNLLKATTERQRIGAELVSSLAQTAASAYTGGAIPAGGKVGGGGGASSQQGAKINYFDKTAKSAAPRRRSGRHGSPGRRQRSWHHARRSIGWRPAGRSEHELLAEPRGARVRLGQQQVALRDGRRPHRQGRPDREPLRRRQRRAWSRPGGTARLAAP